MVRRLEVAAEEAAACAAAIVCMAPTSAEVCWRDVPSRLLLSKFGEDVTKTLKFGPEARFWIAGFIFDRLPGRVVQYIR